MSSHEIKDFIGGIGGRILLIMLSALSAILMMVTTGFSSWAAATLTEIKTNQIKIAAEVQDLQKREAVLAASRFTASDWTTAQSQINDRFGTVESRLTRTEANLENIEQILRRIEDRLKTQ